MGASLRSAHHRLVQARGLPVMDRRLLGGGGTSDPMVTLACCGSSATSSIKKACLEPIWREVKREGRCSQQ